MSAPAKEIYIRGPGTITTGPIQFIKDGSTATVTEDTVTPANSVPLPVTLLDTSGVPADPATSENQVTEIGHLANIDTATAASKADLDTIVTNTTGLATEVTAAASKADLDTIVTNTTGLATETTLSAVKTDADAINTATASIDTKTPALGQAAMAASVPVAIASDQSAVPINAASLPLPTGAATAANQATEITSLASIATSTSDLDTNLGAKADAAATSDTGSFSVIAFIKRGLQNWTTLFTKIPAALGQTTMTGSFPVTLASDQTALPTKAAINPNGSYAEITNLTNTAQTLSVPSNAVGFILEAASSNDQNIRWKIGAAATTTSGMLMEPGRDSGYIPCAANISVISVAAGTETVTVQWVLNQ